MNAASLIETVVPQCSTMVSKRGVWPSIQQSGSIGMLKSRVTQCIVYIGLQRTRATVAERHDDELIMFTHY